MPTFRPKGAQYCYGNYDKYYGYRNSGAFEKDVRLSLLKGEWFEGKDCLDIGSNTGQVCVCLSVHYEVRLSPALYIIVCALEYLEQQVILHYQSPLSHQLIK